MMRHLLLAALLLAASVLGAGGAKADPDNFTEIERGRYLAIAGDCMACHIGADGKSLSGGNMLETPFGRISVPNITPDKETGLGRWSPGDFYRAMHEGKRPDGTHLYPAFPYPDFTKLSRADTDAVFAYLQALPPVEHRVDRDTLPFPFNIRLLMAGWNMLNFEPGEFRPDPQKSAEYNRGAFLVEGPAHCGLCHTPRNIMGGDKDSRFLQGAALQGWFAPSLTMDRRLGLGDWSDEELIAYLRTGRNDRTAASGPMAEVVSFSTSQMTDADLKAIAVYLRENGRAATTSGAATPLAADDARMRTGAAIYADTCKACHVSDGSGVSRMFPRLAGNQLVQQGDPTGVLRVILQGSQSAATPLSPTAPAMPSLGWRLDDRQVADVATYIRNAWGNAAPAVSADEVKKMRDITEAPPR